MDDNERVRNWWKHQMENNYFTAFKFHFSYQKMDRFNLQGKKILEIGCFLPNTNILLPDFCSKPIKDIKKGDIVVTHTGKFKKVLKTFKRKYAGLIKEITVEGMDNIVSATPEHPIYGIKRKKIECLHANGKRQRRICKKGMLKDCLNKYPKCKGRKINLDFLPISKFSEGDYVAVPFPPNKLTTEPVYNPALLRLFGYYLGDGNILYCRGRVHGVCWSIGLSKIENAIRKRTAKNIKEFSKEIFGLDCKEYIRTNKGYTAIHLFNTKIGSLFKKFCGEYAHKKAICDSLIKCMDKRALLELVKGFFECDGHFVNINKDQIRAEMKTVSKKLANQLFYILLANGFKPLIKIEKIKHKKHNDVYKVMLCGRKEVCKFGLLPKEYYAETGSRIIYNNYLLAPIKKIKEIKYEGQVHNLSVDYDNSYVAERVAVHNCGYGRELSQFAKYGGKLAGLDIAPKAPEIAYEKLNEQGINTSGIELDSFDGLNIPEHFKKTKWDFIYNCFVIQHMSKANAKQLIKNSLEILSEDGVLFFEFFGDPDFMGGPGKDSCSGVLEEGGMYNNAFTEEEIIKWLSDMPCKISIEPWPINDGKRPIFNNLWVEIRN